MVQNRGSGPLPEDVTAEELRVRERQPSASTRKDSTDGAVRGRELAWASTATEGSEEADGSAAAAAAPAADEVASGAERACDGATRGARARGCNSRGS